MRHFALVLLLLIGCAGTSIATTQTADPIMTPIVVAPQAPRLMEPLHPKQQPIPANPQMVEAAEHWLTLMIGQLDIDLSDAMGLCAFLGEELKQTEGQFFSCGGADGYTLAVNQEGKVIFVADANHPSWRLDVLRDLLGPDEPNNTSEMVEHRWLKTPRDGVGPSLIISYIEPKDPENRPFVSVQFADRAKLGVVQSL